MNYKIYTILKLSGVFNSFLFSVETNHRNLCSVFHFEPLSRVMCMHSCKLLESASVPFTFLPLHTFSYFQTTGFQCAFGEIITMCILLKLVYEEFTS